MKKTLLATTAGFLAMGLGLAHAQTVDEGFQLEEVIVTVEKRSTDVQSLPLQVNVVGGAALSKAGTTEVQNLQSLIPGIAMQQSGPFTQFTVRGVGSTVTSAFNDTAVAFNLDEVYIGRPTGTHGYFFDLDRIEVLKGPQGTLYGRNATAGAINVVTAQPVFRNTFGVTARYGNYDHVVVNGFANVFRGDTALRVAGQVVQRDGYFDDGYNDEETKAIRAQLLTRPTEDISITLGLDYGTEKGRNYAVVPYPYVTGDPWTGMSSPQVRGFLASNLQPPYSFLVPPGSTNLVDFGGKGQIDHVNFGARAKVDWDLGFANWTTVGAYRTTATDDVTYLGGFAVTTDSKAKQWSVETRMASNSGPDDAFTWLVGAYYFKESQRGPTTIDFADAGDIGNPIFGVGLSVDPTADETWALFTQETLRITDQLRLTAGLRYFQEEKTNRGTTTSYLPFPPVFGSITFANGGRLKWDQVNYRLGLDYQLTERSMIYAAVADGFKAGGFFPGAAPTPINPTPNSYEPEKLTSYTVGTKNRFFDNRLQLNAEIFYWKYEDRQYLTFGPVNTGTPFNVASAITINVGESHVQGASVDALFALTPNTRLSAAVEYIDEAVNDDFIFPSTAPPGVGCTAIAGGLVDCSGSPITYTPRWSATVGLSHAFDLPNDNKIVADVTSKIESERLLGLERRPDQYQGGYTRTDVTVTYETERFSIGAYVRNLEDVTLRNSALLSAITGTPWVDLQPPRTYGVEASFRY